MHKMHAQYRKFSQMYTFNIILTDNLRFKNIKTII